MTELVSQSFHGKIFACVKREKQAKNTKSNKSLRLVKSSLALQEKFQAGGET